MTRKLLALVLLVGLAPPARSQDMPLSQILIDGEGWKKGAGLTAQEQEQLRKWKIGFGLAEVSALSGSPDLSVIYASREDWGHILAWQVEGPLDKDFSGRNRYCQLRVKRGSECGGATALTVDIDGRIYAATELGVQVFDPSGRLCGVLTSPKGKAEFMQFEGDQLTLYVGDTKYTRKLNTKGVEQPPPKPK